jgi:hypothetical protein
MIAVRRVVLSTALIALGTASVTALPAPAKAQASTGARLSDERRRGNGSTRSSLLHH